MSRQFPTEETYIVRSNSDDNATFEVTGKSIDEAARKAIEELGYSITLKKEG